VGTTVHNVGGRACIVGLTNNHQDARVFFFGCFAATQLARPVHQEHTQVVCTNKEARKRLPRRHSRNGPWTHERCLEVDEFVCWECIEELEWLLLLRICLSCFFGFRTPNLITVLNQ